MICLTGGIYAANEYIVLLENDVDCKEENLGFCAKFFCSEDKAAFLVQNRQILGHNISPGQASKT